MAGEMTEFFNILIYGEASYLFLLIFLGIAFIIALKFRYFSVIATVISLFQLYDYASQVPSSSYMWHIVILAISIMVFLLRFAGEDMT
jgi:hypothetical protein